MGGEQVGAEALHRGLDQVFFEAAATKTFADAQIKSAFRERWLGRYLSEFRDFASVAVAERDGMPFVAGYVVGAVHNAAADPRFFDVETFQIFHRQSACYPAHLHINLAPAYRGGGLGGRLVSRFAAVAQMHGARGLHVVTGRRSRNRSFYDRLGLKPVGEARFNDADVMMLAARLPLAAKRPSLPLRVGGSAH